VGAGDDSFSAYNGGAYVIDGRGRGTTPFTESRPATPLSAPPGSTRSLAVPVSDFYKLRGNGGAFPDIVTDFQTGPGGDVLDIASAGPQSHSNNFVDGYLRLVQSGPDTLLQAGDPSSTAYTWQTILVLQSTIATAFTADNFTPSSNPQGPTGITLNGDDNPNTLTGSLNYDVISGTGARTSSRVWKAMTFCSAATATIRSTAVMATTRSPEAMAMIPS